MPHTETDRLIAIGINATMSLAALDTHPEWVRDEYGPMNPQWLIELRQGAADRLAELHPTTAPNEWLTRLKEQTR
jgi:hypothetical protein